MVRRLLERQGGDRLVIHRREEPHPELLVAHRHH
jgi:hypothetical protein